MTSAPELEIASNAAADFAGPIGSKGFAIKPAKTPSANSVGPLSIQKPNNKLVLEEPLILSPT